MVVQRQNAAYVARLRALSVAQAAARGSQYCAERTQLVRVTVDEGTGALLFAQYRVWSGSEPGKDYPLYFDAWLDDAFCPCKFGVAGHACWHRGAVLLAAQELQQTFTRRWR